MLNMRWTVSGWIIVLAIGLTGWLGNLRAAPADDGAKDGGAMPPVGANCQVYLRGDASGIALHDRISDLGNLIMRRGTIVTADKDWVVLKEGDHQYWVPRASIIVIEMGR